MKKNGLNIDNEMSNFFDEIMDLNMIETMGIEGFAKAKIARKVSGVVGKYGMHLPNIDDYKTLLISTIDGQPIIAYDSEYRIMFNVLNLDDELGKQIFDDLQNYFKENILGEYPVYFTDTLSKEDKSDYENLCLVTGLDKNLFFK